MEELIEGANDIQTAIHLAGREWRFAWLKYKSVPSMLLHEDYGVFSASLRYLSTNESRWRPELQRQLRDIEAGQVPLLPADALSRLLTYALRNERCDLIESILRQRCEVSCSHVLQLADHIEALRPVASLVISRCDVCQSLPALLIKGLLPYAIPFLGCVSSSQIVEACREHNIHDVVANGLCSYEDAGVRVLKILLLGAYSVEHVKPFIVTLPDCPAFVELARKAVTRRHCWYWVLYASAEEREKVLAGVQHTRYHARIAMGEEPYPRRAEEDFASWTVAKLHELPLLPADIACWLLMYSFMGGLERVAMKLPCADGRLENLLRLYEQNEALRLLF